jgi:hypothetical protein
MTIVQKTSKVTKSVTPAITTKTPYTEMVDFAKANNIKFLGLRKEELWKQIEKFQNVKNKIKAEDESLDETRTPKQGSISETILNRLRSGESKYFIAKTMQQHYSFIHGVAKRYSHLLK